MTFYGPGDLSRFFGKMNSDTYTGMLQDYYRATCRFYGMSPKNTWFQHDNAPWHTSRATLAYIKLKKIRLLPDWSPYSPDLNPIERVWAYIKRRLAEIVVKNGVPATLDELWEIV